MATYLLRRAANAYPEYIASRLNLGALYMDLLSVKEEKGIMTEDRDRYTEFIRQNFEACISPQAQPADQVPGKVYTTLARIYLVS